jgi:tetratricopeptide (TPR) repeat protein
MNQISKEALDFLNEAREQFKQNTDYTTYRNREDGFIALRTGMFDDCIEIYELGSPIGNFTQQLPRQHKVLIDYDKLKVYEKLQEKVELQIDKVEELVNNEESNKYYEHNAGYLKALKDVLKLLTQ